MVRVGKALNERQLLALEGVSVGYVSEYSAGSLRSLIRRGFVDDRGRYFRHRGHLFRYGITAAGWAALRS